MNGGERRRRIEGPRRVLIVDDVQTNVRLLRAYLGPEGYEVETATSGEDALERLRSRPPDLVLLDVMMPRMNGFDVCRRIKSDEATRGIPVILVTSLTSIDDKVEGQRAGADDFVSKPFQREELLVRVQSMLRIKDLHDSLAEKIAELEHAKSELRRLADTDGLTALPNQRHLRPFLEKELARARRYRRPLSIVMLDLDRFKLFNDTWGHPEGDRLLRELSALLVRTLRDVDLAARYGGEEFLLALVETDRAAAATVAEKVRRSIAEHAFEAGGAQRGPITASLGVASYPEDGETRDALVAAADRRLYRAKECGRNRVVAEDA